ncbi:MAG: hypothetical protein A2521_07235 [Deltaproteobacteria bacterium RIFOXYD12_FULL_57_12]|nr:MAG: hypothetical protein A2521_07235 [Deltaproteobacteria bacterium RIFOXYD12_FULL_57_12]
MKIANIAEFKNNLSKYLALVEQGEEIEICKRNIPVARLVSSGPRKKTNRTVLGCGHGSVQVKVDLTEPLIPQDSWEMLGK